MIFYRGFWIEYNEVAQYYTAKLALGNHYICAGKENTMKRFIDLYWKLERKEKENGR